MSVGQYVDYVPLFSCSSPNCIVIVDEMLTFVNRLWHAVAQVIQHINLNMLFSRLYRVSNKLNWSFQVPASFVGQSAPQTRSLWRSCLFAQSPWAPRCHKTALLSSKSNANLRTTTRYNVTNSNCSGLSDTFRMSGSSLFHWFGPDTEKNRADRICQCWRAARPGRRGQ